MINFILKIIKNPIIGPIVVTAITLPILMIYYLPHVFIENEKNKIIKESLTIVDHLKTFRTYYDNFVISKIQESTKLEINFNHEISPNTVPLPATTIHNLSKKLSETNNTSINFVSDYPFPNRTNRELDDFQKESIKEFRDTKQDLYIKEDIYNNQAVLRVAFPDIMVSQSCIDCHNSRSDSPKKDWQIDDVRGIIEVIMPLRNQFILTPYQTKVMIVFMILILLAFILHYGILYIKKEKEARLITKQLRKEVKKRTKELEESSLLLHEYKKAVDASAIVSKADIEGNITYVNDTFCQISGYEREELIGKPHNIVRHPDMTKEFFENLWITIQNKEIFKGVITNKAKNNEKYFVANTIVPILNKKGTIIEYLSLRYDITELVKAKEEALEIQESKAIFLANMSHEIRTPLNAIIGFSDILCQSTIGLKDKEQAKIISKSAKSLLGIINDILDISKIESGNLVLENIKFSLNELVEDIVELFSINTNSKNIKFFYTTDSNLPLIIKGDPTRIKQVLSNLLSNAIKFTPQNGEITLEIKVLNFDSLSKKARISFSVKDSGIGMTKEQLGFIFKPFKQADSGITRQFGGTGLGLSICCDIVKAMNSEIKVFSHYGKGSEFSFDIEFEVFEKFKEIIQKTDLKIAICSLDFDSNNLKSSVRNYLLKIGTVLEAKDKNSIDAQFLFCFESNSINEDLANFKNKNHKAKIIFIGDKNSLNQKSLNFIDHFLSLPIYGSKIYNIIAQNSIHQLDILNQAHVNIDQFEANILVAEDNINNQKLIFILLEKLGIFPTIVSNGKEALEAYKSNFYDLILMDINMPILDGVAATKEIRKFQKDESYYDVPIVALTANVIVGDKEMYLKEGMNGYLAKPIIFEELVKTLKHFLKKDNQINIGIDLTKISQKLGIPNNVANALVERFEKEIVIDLEDLYQKILSNDSRGIFQKAYYIRNSCLNICLDSLFDNLLYLESNSSEDSEKLLNFYTKIYDEIADIFNFKKVASR